MRKGEGGRGKRRINREMGDERRLEETIRAVDTLRVGALRQ